jgi:hypothetical protein
MELKPDGWLTLFVSHVMIMFECCIMIAIRGGKLSENYFDRELGQMLSDSEFFIEAGGVSIEDGVVRKLCDLLFILFIKSFGNFCSNLIFNLKNRKFKIIKKVVEEKVLSDITHK